MTSPHAPHRHDTHTRITVYSRPDCHLCDDMKAMVMRLATTMGLTVEEVDISKDAELEARFGLEIPVLFVNDRKVAKYRISEEELRTCLSSRRNTFKNA